MKRHFVISISAIIAIISFWNGESSAFWGSNSTDSASGLNVSAGFDVNTITTVTGTVMTLPEGRGREQHALMSVSTQKGDLTVILGPSWHWEKQTITFAINQDVTVTGSLAQGKDGSLYLFAQRVENRSNRETVTLRSESGKPFWSRSGAEIQTGTRPYGGSGIRAGAGNRGGGMRGGRR